MAYIEIGREVFTEDDFSDGGHVDSFVRLVEEIEYVVANSLRAGSTTANTIATGSKTFVTDVVVPWVVNEPIAALDTTAPSTKSMIGRITAISDDGVNSTITINVTTAVGSGSHASWNLIPFPESTTVMASSPATEPQGGWAANNFAAGRKNAQVARQVDIIGICNAVPVTASNGDKFIVDSTGTTGACVGQENKIGTRTSSTTATFETAVKGDMCFDLGSMSPSERTAGEDGAYYVYMASNQNNTLLNSSAGKWLYAAGNQAPLKFNEIITITSNTTIDRSYHGKIIRCTNGSNITLTFSHDTTNYYLSQIYQIVCDGAGTVDLVVSGSGTFQYSVGGSSYVSSISLTKGSFVTLYGVVPISGNLHFLVMKSAPLAIDTGILNGAFLRLTSDVAFGSLQVSELDWDVEDYDTVNCWSSGSRITVPAGYTKAKAEMQIKLNSGLCAFELINADNVNQRGTFYKTIDASGTDIDNTFSAWMNVTAGDELYVNTSSGIAGSDINGVDNYSWLNIEFLR